MKIFECAPSQAPRILQYNAETDLAEIEAPRYSETGVDLSALAVGITTNLRGQDNPDRILQIAGDGRITVEALGDSLLVRWRIGLNTTINPGCVQFMVDFRDEKDAVVWHSREYYLQIDPALTAESLVAQYPSMFVQYEAAMRKLYADAQAAVEWATAEAGEAKGQADRANNEADRAEGAREDVTTAKAEVEAMRETVAVDKAAVEAAQKEAETRQAEISVAHEDVKTKTAAVLRAAEQVGSDKQAVEQAATAFDGTVVNATKAIDDKAAAARRDLDGAVSSATGEINSAVAAAEARINKTAADCAESMAQQAQDVADSVDAAKTDVAATASSAKADISDTASSAKTDIAAMASTAQGAATSAAQSAAQAAQSAQEAQAAADSIGDAIIPALLTTKAAGTGAVTMGNTADYPLQSLVITGATQQDSTPEPGSPVYPVSVGDDGTIGVKVCGPNRIDWEGAADYSNWQTTSLDDDHPYGYYPYLIVDGFVPGETYTIAADSIPELGAADLYCLLGTYPGANKGQANWLYHKTAEALCRPVRTFVADAYTYYLNCSGCRADTVSQVVHDWLPNLRIYQGSYTADTVPPYEPYKGQTVTIPVERPIMRIGSAADTINPLTGDGLQMCDKIEFDGTEKWVSPPGSYANYTYCVMISEKAPGNQTSVCSHYRNVDQAYSANIGEPGMYCDHKTNLYIYFVSEKSTLGEFTAWLAEQKAAGTPVTLWYQLAQPNTYQVTPVSDLRSYDGTTTAAAYGAPGEPFPGIESTAVQNINLVLKELKQAIIAGGAT